MIIICIGKWIRCVFFVSLLCLFAFCMPLSEKSIKMQKFTMISQWRKSEHVWTNWTDRVHLFENVLWTIHMTQKYFWHDAFIIGLPAPINLQVLKYSRATNCITKNIKHSGWRIYIGQCSSCGKSINYQVWIILDLCLLS